MSQHDFEDAINGLIEENSALLDGARRLHTIAENLETQAKRIQSEIQSLKQQDVE